MNKLIGKKALVTGGSRGIGAAIVKRLAAEGVNIAFTYAHSFERAQQVVKEAEKLNVKACSIQADSADPAAVQEAVKRAISELGGIDILVNNAGIGEFNMIDDVSLASFEQSFAVNVRAVFVAIQETIKQMPKGGRIINIGSANGTRMPFAGGSVYAMTKSALNGLTRGIARDLGPRGITINTIQPGPVDTELNPANGERAEIQKQLNAIPRFATAEEIASLVIYLASEDAAFVTGSSINIDGGLCC